MFIEVVNANTKERWAGYLAACCLVITKDDSQWVFVQGIAMTVAMKLLKDSKKEFELTY